MATSSSATGPVEIRVLDPRTMRLAITGRLADIEHALREFRAVQTSAQPGLPARRVVSRETRRKLSEAQKRRQAAMAAQAAPAAGEKKKPKTMAAGSAVA